MHFQSDNEGFLAEINIIPLVDVVLVLLIIFMVAAPMMQQGVQVNLPQANAPQMDPKTTEPLIVTLTKSGKMYLNESEIESKTFSDKIKGIIENQPDRPVYIRADGELPYQKVVNIIATLKEIGAIQVGMATQSK